MFKNMHSFLLMRLFDQWTLMLQAILQQPMLLTLPLLLFLSAYSQPISAQLKLIQFSPLTFLLSFSEPVTRPPFQLLLNGFIVLNATFPDPPSPLSVPAASYVFTSVNSLVTLLQNYSVQFIRPLAVGGGRLQLQSYVVQAKKAGVIVQYSEALSIFVVAASYVLIYFTLLGHIFMEFLQIYCLFMYHDSQKTTTYQKISQGMLMINPDAIRASGGGAPMDFVAIAFPPFIILLTGAIGFILRWKLKGEKSLASKIFYEVGVYNLFISAALVFIFPMIFNSLQFFQLVREGAVADPALRVVGLLLSYLSLVLTFAVLYLFVFAMNPKWGESEQSWKNYLQSEAFDNYRKLWEGLWLNWWARRNKIIFTIVKRILAVMVYFWSSGFEVVIFLLEFATLFYVFTVRPYKAEIYLNSAVVCRLLLFYFYGCVVLGNLYFSLGDITINYLLIQGFLKTTFVVFLIIVVFLFLFIFYDMYLSFNDLNYSLKLVKEENQYKLKLVEKDRGSSDERSKRKTFRSDFTGRSKHGKPRKESLEEGKADFSFPNDAAHLPLMQEEDQIRVRSNSKRQTMESAVNYRYSTEKSLHSKHFSKKQKKESLLDSIIKQ